MEYEGDSEGIRGGFLGDSRGIHTLLGGFTSKVDGFGVGFRGIHAREPTPFIILKKGNEAVGRPCSAVSKILIALTYVFLFPENFIALACVFFFHLFAFSSF